MQLLFLSHELSKLEDVSKKIFSVLSIETFEERESENVLNGYYFVQTLLGMRIKIEYNSYDFEDKYKYMISMEKDYSSKIHFDNETEVQFSILIALLLSKNLVIEIAMEKPDGELMLF